MIHLIPAEEVDARIASMCSGQSKFRMPGKELACISLPNVQDDLEYHLIMIEAGGEKLLLVSDCPVDDPCVVTRAVTEFHLSREKLLQAQICGLEACQSDSMEALTGLYEELTALYDLSKLTGKKVITFYDVDQLMREILLLIAESGIFSATRVVIAILDGSGEQIRKIAGWSREGNDISALQPGSPEWEELSPLMDYTLDNRRSLMLPQEADLAGIRGELQAPAMLIEPIFSAEEKKMGSLMVAKSSGVFTEKMRNFLGVIASHVSLIVSLGNTFQEVLNKKKIERELELAAEIQKKLLPKKQPFLMGWDVFGLMHTARIVGGDYFDYFIDEDRRFLNVIIADVSGKGISAALVMATFRGILRTMFEETSDLVQIVEKLNISLRKDVEGEKFVTLFFLNLELATGKARFIKAGHNPPLVYTNDVGTISYLEAPGLFLGMFDDLMVEVREHEFALGDGLLLYTDGATEIVNASGEEFGMENLENVFTQGLKHEGIKLTLDEIYNSIDHFRVTMDRFDDITLIGMKRFDFVSGE
ncbi:MAG: SpoIIE family protein phosphatase, partial [Candidatus Wallbacteria bacterium]|nr:SpoIIE family protein phosphatase [Candidatus Wallbacteria bacterium]